MRRPHTAGGLSDRAPAISKVMRLPEATGETYSFASLLRRGSKGFFSGGEDPLSNVSAGTGLAATAVSTGASARYHAQDDRHPGEVIFYGLLARVACVPCISKNGVQDDVEGLAKTYLNAWKSGKVCCFYETVFLNVFCLPPRG